MGGAPIPKWDPIGFEPWPYVTRRLRGGRQHRLCPTLGGVAGFQPAIEVQDLCLRGLITWSATWDDWGQPPKR